MEKPDYMALGNAVKVTRTDSPYIDKVGVIVEKPNEERVNVDLGGKDILGCNVSSLLDMTLKVYEDIQEKKEKEKLEAAKNIIIVNETQLIKLSKDAKEAFNKLKGESFNEAFKAERDMIKPVNKWANDKLTEAFHAMDMSTSNDNLRRAGLQSDQNACGVKAKMGTEEYYKEMREATLIFENEEFEITGIIDYDMDTTLLKYTVKSKLTELSHREMAVCP